MKGEGIQEVIDKLALEELTYIFPHNQGLD
jgi:hypothetical protein